MSIAVTAAWVLFVLAVAPRLSWDEFEGRHRPLLAVLTATCLPAVLIVAPVALAVMFPFVWLTEIAPRQIAKWWNASWAPTTPPVKTGEG